MAPTTPSKNITSEQVIASAAKIRRAFSRLQRWLMGVDYQGQYSARPGEKMLDIGCGSGLSLLEVQALGVDAWGIEADPNAQRFAGQLGLRIHQGNLRDNPFSGTSFDLIVLNQVIEHIPEPAKALMKKCVQDDVLVASLVEQGKKRLQQFEKMQNAAEKELTKRLLQFEVRRRCWASHGP
jgi:2-polyprenyl-3-methyl-5-hydroxy-6-metoxy-1,4-benzoquinol methylase